MIASRCVRTCVPMNTSHIKYLYSKYMHLHLTRKFCKSLSLSQKKVSAQSQSENELRLARPVTNIIYKAITHKSKLKPVWPKYDPPFF